MVAGQSMKSNSVTLWRATPDVHVPIYWLLDSDADSGEPVELPSVLPGATPFWVQVERSVLPFQALKMKSGLPEMSGKIS